MDEVDTNLSMYDCESPVNVLIMMERQGPWWPEAEQQIGAEFLSDAGLAQRAPLLLALRPKCLGQSLQGQDLLCVWDRPSPSRMHTQEKSASKGEEQSRASVTWTQCSFQNLPETGKAHPPGPGRR